MLRAGGTVNRGAGGWARAAAWGVLGMTVVGAGVVLAGPPVRLLDLLAARHPGCLYRVASREPVVALTLDDGPDPATTPPLLDLLRSHGAHATFFLIGERARGQERLVGRIAAAGHEIGNHFTHDRPGIALDRDEFERDLLEAHAVLAPRGALRWARPGAGWYSQAMIATLRRHGYRCALGSVYPWDAAIPWPAFATRHILHNVRPGAILVLHDGGARGRRTLRILGDVLPELRRRGFRVVTLSELVETERRDG